MFTHDYQRINQNKIDEIKIRFASFQDESIKELIKSLEQANATLNDSMSPISLKVRNKRRELFASNISLSESAIQSLLKSQAEATRVVNHITTQFKNDTLKAAQDDVKLLTKANLVIACKDTDQFSARASDFNDCWTDISMQKSDAFNKESSARYENQKNTANLRMGLLITANIFLFTAFVLGIAGCGLPLLFIPAGILMGLGAALWGLETYITDGRNHTSVNFYRKLGDNRRDMGFFAHKFEENFIRPQKNPIQIKIKK